MRIPKIIDEILDFDVETISIDKKEITLFFHEGVELDHTHHRRTDNLVEDLANILYYYKECKRMGLKND